MILTLCLVFLATMTLGFPVAFCLGLTSLAALILGDVPLLLLAQRMFTGIDSFPLMAVPFFVLAGELMNRGGTTKRLINFANVLVGRIPGGLAHTNILASMFFGGISGSAVADAAAMGSVLVPGMISKGFPPGFSAAVTAASSTMGPIIPPSIFMVLMGVTTGLSIGGLFAAGIVPGLLLGLSMMALSYIMAVRHRYPKESIPLSAGLIFREFLSAGPALLAPVIILGGNLRRYLYPNGIGSRSRALLLCPGQVHLPGTQFQGSGRHLCGERHHYGGSASHHRDGQYLCLGADLGADPHPHRGSHDRHDQQSLYHPADHQSLFDLHRHVPGRGGGHHHPGPNSAGGDQCPWH